MYVLAKPMSRISSGGIVGVGIGIGGGLFCCLLCPGTDQHGNCLQQFGARHHTGEGMCTV